MPVSYYKGERLGKAPPCAICAGPGHGRREELHLPYGVSVWLCAMHRGGEFASRRSGRDLTVSLMHVWGAAGCLTRRRHKALASLLRAAQSRDRRLPGSYAWPTLREEAERRFAGGETVRRVSADLTARLGRGDQRPPSVRTIQRWFSDGRWRPRERHPPDRPSPRHPHDRRSGPPGTPEQRAASAQHQADAPGENGPSVPRLIHRPTPVRHQVGDGGQAMPP